MKKLFVQRRFLILIAAILFVIPLVAYYNYSYTSICDKTYPTVREKDLHKVSYNECLESAGRANERKRVWFGKAVKEYILIPGGFLVALYCVATFIAKRK